MARLLPTGSDTTVERTDDPAVLYVDDRRTREMISVLAVDTGYDIFQLLNRRTATASEIAAEMDLSIQNTSYHLKKLEAAELISVVDTCYSEKGREMAVYAVTRDPKVVVLGTEADQQTLRKAFARMAGVIGVPAILIAAWESVANVATRVQEH
ncbi:ArsR/SmtB family transcription factor [Halorubrum vacuolatum]|uniref:Helix-turn-helix domain-containing protein n=1 Tax=Halorubrum vacuolatum TaxID=63740 RepID=A0A238VC16_HALVU|nr:winged helix-turn-helix domain-containing protein [Halorubrum vacuolatum]SNR31771.1 Helix-turn-helix domain-containing protein [Halorubrum vacuolatum]